MASASGRAAGYLALGFGLGLIGPAVGGLGSLDRSFTQLESKLVGIANLLGGVLACALGISAKRRGSMPKAAAGVFVALATYGFAAAPLLLHETPKAPEPDGSVVFFNPDRPLFVSLSYVLRLASALIFGYGSRAAWGLDGTRPLDRNGVIRLLFFLAGGSAAMLLASACERFALASRVGACSHDARFSAGGWACFSWIISGHLLFVAAGLTGAGSYWVFGVGRPAASLPAAGVRFFGLAAGVWAWAQAADFLATGWYQGPFPSVPGFTGFNVVVLFLGGSAACAMGALAAPSSARACSLCGVFTAASSFLLTTFADAVYELTIEDRILGSGFGLITAERCSLVFRLFCEFYATGVCVAGAVETYVSRRDQELRFVRFTSYVACSWGFRTLARGAVVVDDVLVRVYFSTRETAGGGFLREHYTYGPALPIDIVAVAFVLAGGFFVLGAGAWLRFRGEEVCEIQSPQDEDASLMTVVGRNAWLKVHGEEVCETQPPQDEDASLIL